MLREVKGYWCCAGGKMLQFCNNELISALFPCNFNVLAGGGIFYGDY
jgi:hypothetical protein